MDKEQKEKIGQGLLLVRTFGGQSQKAMAAKIGVNVNTYTKIERFGGVTPNTLQLIEDATGLTANDLVSCTDAIGAIVKK